MDKQLNQELLQNEEVREIGIALLCAKLDFLNPVQATAYYDSFITKHTAPKALLVTEDGVSITEGNTLIWRLNTDSLGFKMQAVYSCSKHPKWLDFSTEAAMNIYILWNKKCLSGKDVQELLNEYMSGLSKSVYGMAKLSLETLLKSK